MGSVNRQLVREEAERIRAEFQRLVADKNIAPEIQVLMQSMFTLIQLLIAIFLEKTTKKDSKNSSKPSSQTEKDESAVTHPGTQSRGKAESDIVASNTRTIETVTVAKVTKCDICGQDLRNAPCQSIERRTKIDIVFEKVVEHVDAEIKHCERCDATVKGRFPGDMPGPLQYGDGLKAYVISLLVGQMISLSRVQKLVKTLIGIIIAEASFLQFILRLHQALESWELTAREQLLKSLAMNVDETSLRVDKKNYWIHVYSAGDIALKLLHGKRGIEAIEANNIIPQYGGTIIHDCWSSYLTYHNCHHGLCGSHIVRELTYLVDSNGYAWASNMKALLLDTCKEVSKRKKKMLTAQRYVQVQKQ